MHPAILVALIVAAVAVVVWILRSRRPTGGAAGLHPAKEKLPLPKAGERAAADEPEEPEADHGERQDDRDREGPWAGTGEETEPPGEEEAETGEEAEPRPGEEARPPDVPPAQPREAGESREDRRRRVGQVRKGLAATRGGLVARLGRLFKGKKEISPELLQNIEEILITSDVGAKTTERLVARMKEALSGKDLSDEKAVWSFLREEALAILDVPVSPIEVPQGHPRVILVLGVNGVGKTTTIGKLAAHYRNAGHRVILAAADTFRAAAVQQLQIWGRRVGCEVVSGKDNADPSSIAFQAIARARETGADVVMVDTAGRLHTKAPLMEELKKIARVVGKAAAGAPHETLLVLDANTGQNANQQATTFRAAVPVTGIALTKLDGTAKGGVILGICDEHRVPVRYIGVGEGIEDLRTFDPELFAAALFDDVEEIGEAAA
jgi:fused signal recognition particle receptor